MAELADAYGSGPYGSNTMRVQVSFPAGTKSASRNRSAFSVRMRNSADKPYRQRGLQHMVLYFIRHGETSWNVEGKMQGQTDIPLNENGIRLAEETAEGMKEIPFDLCITSPLSRARQTAEIVLGSRKVPIIEDARIEELSFGNWEGIGCRPENYAVPTPIEEFQKFYTEPFAFVPGEGGETILQLCKRTKEFWDEVTAKPEYEDKTILIATHGCALRAILHNVYEDKADFWHGFVPVNCAVSVVEVKDGNAKLVGDDRIYYNAKEVVNHFNVKKMFEE